jgi:hypothetical protein
MELLAGACSGTADAVDLLFRGKPIAACRSRQTVSAVHSRDGLSARTSSRSRQGCGVLPGECTEIEHALDRLRQVEPAAALLSFDPWDNVSYQKLSPGSPQFVQKLPQLLLQ